LDRAQSGCLVFAKAVPADAHAGACYIAPDRSDGEPAVTVLMSVHPRRDFIRALLQFEAEGLLARVETPASIHPTALIGANAVIEANCEIAEGVVIEPNVVILKGTRIGAFSRIRANSTIGSDGFGFERDESGEVLRFVHLGGVRIGRHVEVGANTCIARGTLDDTVIEDEAKIDNLVHIAHNVRIGRRAFVIAGTEVSGGCHIGDDAWIGPNTCIREKVRIGERALIGIGSTVLRSVPPGEVHAGNPARFLRTVY
jgi:UDP-3-O-[3-hydroxymyristoyl] glucosamine N-acyltransferase